MRNSGKPWFPCGTITTLSLIHITGNSFVMLEQDVTIKAEFTQSQITGIRVKTQPAKTEYKINETLDLAGLDVYKRQTTDLETTILGMVGLFGVSSVIMKGP